MKITFLGAVEEVTGSKYLIEHEDTRILVDCGLFQGEQEIAALNWQAFPIDPKSINAIILTHAHIDHSGYIPVLVKKGFRGTIYCSKATYELCALLLRNSGKLFEENAKQDNPLYTQEDAEYALRFFQVEDYNKIFKIGSSLEVHLIFSGHILGSSFVIISDGKQKITFSGDLGRPHSLIMKAPVYLKQTDYLVLESTYGDRLHEQGDPLKILADIVHKTVAKGGVLVIPVFAVGRTQEILYCLYELLQKNLIPHIPIFLDSPLAIDSTNLFCAFKQEYAVPQDQCKDIFKIAQYTRTVEESKHINQRHHSMIIIAGGGMADGGRVLYHFEHYIADPKNTIVFVGYQAEGTHGRILLDGAKKIEIYDKMYTVRAEIKTINTLSAHADYNEILEWLSHFESAPKKIFLTHGQKESAQSLKNKIEERFGWAVVIPKYLESCEVI